MATDEIVVPTESRMPPPVDALDNETSPETRRVLGLSARSTFCLHAGAVRVGEEKIVAFVGDSGVGKSTLTAALHRKGRGLVRVADDILPAFVDGREVRVDPHIPQPRLSPEEQYPADDGARLRLVAIYVLTPPPDRHAPVRVEELRPYERLAAVAGHTMAARLFDEALLDAHLEFCRRVAEAVEVRRLVYPHRLSSFGAVRGVLRAEFPSLG